MGSSSDLKKISIVILAAGGSTRLGSPKQLLKDNQGETLIRRIGKIAQSIPIEKIVCILGAQHEVIGTELEDLAITTIVNDQWSSGIASSIILSVKTISEEDPAVEAILFLVCDQPFVDKVVIESILHSYIKTQKPIVASQYQKILGTPALFHRSIFPALMLLNGDRGAGKVIQENMDRVALIEFEAGIFDIDTQGDYDLYQG